MTAATLRSWGNHPNYPQVPQACHWRDELPRHLARVVAAGSTTLAFGAGRSYGDSCLAASDRVLHMLPLDRFIDADWVTGVVIAEAGVTLSQILDIAVPRGWFLMVTPGTRYVTLGGAIANDVHGKNHHRRGTFGRYVRRLGLLRSDEGRLTCSMTERRDLFSATVGGLGLTGLVEWAEIQLLPIRASQLVGITQRFGDLGEFFSLSALFDERHEFCVSWIDCAARGSATGRGVYMAGDFAEEGTLEVEPSRGLGVPAMLPFSVVNWPTLKLFNGAYWRKAPRTRAQSSMRYDSFFYPLDSVQHWNRIYGRKGFQQYQCLIPVADARAGIRAMLVAIANSGTGSFLSVLKRCGDLVSPGLLSFPQPGTTLALDFPQSDDLEKTLFPHLDGIVRETGGRLYPAKDAHMSGEDFRRSYPAWQRLEAARDPALLSRFWRRVTS